MYRSVRFQRISWQAADIVKLAKVLRSFINFRINFCSSRFGSSYLLGADALSRATCAAVMLWPGRLLATLTSVASGCLTLDNAQINGPIDHTVTPFPDIYTTAELTTMGYFAQTTEGYYLVLTINVTSTCPSAIHIGFSGSGGRHIIIIPAGASSQIMSVTDQITYGNGATNSAAFELRLGLTGGGGTVGSCTITLQNVTLCDTAAPTPAPALATPPPPQFGSRGSS